MARYIDESSQGYEYPHFPQEYARYLAFDHALKVVQTYGLKAGALLSGWNDDEKAQLIQYIGKRGGPNTVGIISTCQLRNGYGYFKSILTREYD
ncbi:MAG: hypothetical protein IKI57_00675 [Clostridia bacterium]|nr:hypothetical protein [Clostridia bacterium]